ncbi:MATE family efflux transporter [Lacrimispora sp. AGF001]|uniref:MATE family efflux transporter n=1 Tax=Lacrimispora sp. AGF001 TaxID=3401631 RepID=UPI003B42C812
MLSPQLKNVLKIVIPTVFSQCAIFLFTIIDGIFVGRGVGTDALGAVNMALPFMMIIAAAYLLTTIGGVTIVAIRIGRKDVSGANQAFMHALCLTALLSAIFMIIGTVFNEVLVMALGAAGVYHDMVSEYIFWCSIFTIPSAMSITLQGFGRNDNAPILVMVATIASTVCNIFLDWLFVFPLQKGLAGAAIATGISQLLSFLIIAMHFIWKRGDLRIGKFKVEGALVKKVLTRGLPEMLSQLATPIMTICMNAVVLRYIGNNGINAYSVISYISAFTFAVILGVAEGMQPLFGHSFGEQNEQDLKYYFRVGRILSFVGSLLVYIVTFFVGANICKLFGADAAATEVAVETLPKYGWVFLFAALNTINGAYLYSTKRTKESVLLNVLRGFVIIPACVWSISIISNGTLIWFTVGIGEVLSLLVGAVIVKRSERNGLRFS